MYSRSKTRLLNDEDDDLEEGKNRHIWGKSNHFNLIIVALMGLWGVCYEYICHMSIYFRCEVSVIYILLTLLTWFFSLLLYPVFQSA